MSTLPPLPLQGLNKYVRWTLTSLAAMTALYLVDVAGRVTVNKFVSLQASALNAQQQKEVIVVAKTLTQEGSYLAELKSAQSQIIEKMHAISQLQQQVAHSAEQVAQRDAACAKLNIEMAALRDRRVSDLLAVGISLHTIRKEIKSGNFIKKLGNAINGNEAVAAVDKELAMINGLILADEKAEMIDHTNSSIESLFKQFNSLRLTAK